MATQLPHTLNDRPPAGLVPKYLWKEQRLKDIKAAIKRYLDGNFPFPPEWVEEYNELLKEIKK